ncbi:hypothetical protein XENOCAPTIV_014899, partial [Xenoophorus captivus]
FTTLMVYKIPMEDVKSLAHSFSQLESGEFLFSLKSKQKVLFYFCPPITEKCSKTFPSFLMYHLYISQVFLEFAKEQENDEDEEFLTSRFITLVPIFFTQMFDFFSFAPVCVGNAVNTDSVSMQMFLQELVLIQAGASSVQYLSRNCNLFMAFRGKNSRLKGDSFLNGRFLSGKPSVSVCQCCSFSSPTE